jgi:hypothetical protein
VGNPSRTPHIFFSLKCLHQFTFFTRHVCRLFAPSLQEWRDYPDSFFTIYLAKGIWAPGSELRDLAVLLLEIISGRHAIDVNYSPPSVVDWAVPLIKDSKFVEICGSVLGSNCTSPFEPALPHVLRSRGLWDEAVPVSSGQWASEQGRR